MTDNDTVEWEGSSERQSRDLTEALRSQADAMDRNTAAIMRRTIAINRWCSVLIVNLAILILIVLFK